MLQSEIKELIDRALGKAAEHFARDDSVNAEEMYRQILRVDPGNQEALEIGSLAVSRNGDQECAKGWAVRALADDDNNYRLHNNLGLIHGCLGEHEQAVRCFERAIAIRPDQAFLHTNLAIELKKQGDYERAFGVLEGAASSHPDCEHVFFNYGAIVHELGQLDRAVGLYERALGVCYDFPVCHYNLSACYFLLGDYARAWPEYEWRWRHFAHFAKVRDRFGAPYWTGQDLGGKTVLLYNEQGSGDTIMMIRFAKMLKERGARVVLECPAPLVGLLSSCEGLDDVCDCFGGALDYHCSLMSLPGVLGVTKDNVPYERGYVAADLGDCAGWEAYGGRRIGITWTGNPMHPNDRNRSCRLALFKKLGDRVFFSLQYDSRPHCYQDVGEVDWTAGAKGLRLVDLSEHMNDFTCTAKLVQRMDLLITVDSAVAHVAGALGVPTWLLLPYVPDWRWGMRGEGTGWYPGVRIFRQGSPGDWEGVFSRVRDELTKGEVFLALC